VLTLEPPYYEIAGTRVFRDHAAAGQFYYAAPAPRLATADGRLMFDLMAYSVPLEHSPLGGTRIPGELGAGFLNLGVHCALDEAARRRVIRGLEELTGIPAERVNLYPIPYHRGTVSLMALDQYHTPDDGAPAAADAAPAAGRPTFVQAVLGAGRPNLGGDLRAVFSLRLSQEGLIFLQGLYETGAAPVGVVYDLTFYGLRPIVEARVTADLSRIHTHFGGELSGACSWGEAEIGAEMEQLEREGAIEVELTSGAVGAEAERSRERALSLFKDEIIQRLFHPVSPSAPVEVSDVTRAVRSLTDQARKSSTPVQLALTYRRTSELGNFTYDFRERSPKKRRHAPQAFLPSLLTPERLRERIHRIPLEHSFFDHLEVLMTGPTPEEFAALGLRQVQAHVRYGEEDDPRPPETAALLFRPDSTGDRTFAFRRGDRESLTYSCGLTYEFAPDPQIAADAPRYAIPPRRRAERALTINPRADFGMHTLEVGPGRLHPDVREVDVQLEYVSPDGEFSARRHLRFPAEEPGDPGTGRRWRVRTRSPEAGRFTARCIYVFSDGDTYRAPAVRCEPPLFLVDSPFVGERELFIRPNPISPQVEQIDVQWRYEDAGNDYRRGGRVQLVPPFASLTQSWPVLDPDCATVRYRVTTYEAGLVARGEWTETAEPSILVGDVQHRAVRLQLRLTGPSLEEIGIDALLVRIRPADAPASLEQPAHVFIEPDAREAEAELMLPPGASLQYEYQITAYRRDGTVSQSPWREETAPYLIIPTQNL